MKHSLRLVVLIAGASVIAGAGFLVACSDDTSVSPNTDGGSDGPTPVPEGGSDAGGDARGDTAPPFDGGFVVDTFDSVLATELCRALARCCYGSPTPADGGADGGTFNVKACEQQFGRVGFEGSNADSALKDGGKVLLDQTNADGCVSKIKAMTCNLPGTEFTAIRKACFGAYRGSVAAGGACVGSVECQLGSFCKTAGDAGTGVCTAIRALNGACGDSNLDHADEACSYRAGGDTGNYCKFGDIVTGVILPPAGWKCTGAGGAATDCASSLWCKDTICNADSKCETPNSYFAPVCGIFVK